MSYSVLKKGEVVMGNFSTVEDAQRYVDRRCQGMWNGEYKEDYEIRNDGGCYLTTATVDYLGLADDCDQLTVLRRFRDTYLVSFEEGRKDIEAYYRIAPKIVARIAASPNKEDYLEKINAKLIQPCVAMIEKKQYHEAYDLYKTFTLKLNELLD